MAITVPIAGQEISASVFGIPVANTVNSLGAAKSVRPSTVNVASGANTAILSGTYTVPASVLGLFYTITVGYTTTGVGDLLSGASVIAPLPAGNGLGATSNGILLKSGSTVTVNFRVYAWGGAAISIDGNKSIASFLSLTAIVSGDVFP